MEGAIEVQGGCARVRAINETAKTACFTPDILLHDDVPWRPHSNASSARAVATASGRAAQRSPARARACPPPPEPDARTQSPNPPSICGADYRAPQPPLRRDEGSRRCPLEGRCIALQARLDL